MRLFGQNASIVYDRDFRLLLLANAIGSLGSALVSPVLDSLMGQFGVSVAEIGLLITAVAAPSMLLIPLSGVLTDRFGRKPFLVAGLLIFGAGGVGIAFTTDFRVALGLRALQGIGFAGVIPVIITSLGDLYEGDVEATAQGIRFGTTGASQAVFPVIAGLIVGVSWRYPFLIYGLAIPIAVVVAIWFNEPADRIPDTAQSKREYLVRLGRLATRRRVFAYLVARVFVVVPFFAFLTYNSLIVVRLQEGSSEQAGILVALFSVAYALTATQAGRITANFEYATVPLVIANLCLGGGLAAFAVSPSVAISMLTVVAMGVGVGLTFSLYRSILTGLAPGYLRGGLVSIGESGARLLVTTTPLAIGIALVSAEPMFGSETALRWIIVAAGIFGGTVGIACVIVARISPSVPRPDSV
jgi:MFS family permease